MYKTFHSSDIRQQINRVTSYVDASMVYGSTEEKAKELRSLQNGNVKCSGNKR